MGFVGISLFGEAAPQLNLKGNRHAQVRAAVAVNQELVQLYWGIGKEILARQSAEGWGKTSFPAWPRTCRLSSLR